MAEYKMRIGNSSESHGILMRESQEDRWTLIATGPFEAIAGRFISLMLANGKAAEILGNLTAVVHSYRDWFEYAPEDSWRYQRDIMAALSMEFMDEDNYIDPTEFMPADLDDEMDMRL
jgi:hypothetical protein